MIKINNKGFAISTLLYSMLILVMMIVMIMLSIMATTRKTTKELSETIEQELTGYAETEAEFNVDGTYKIPKDGWYKIEIWNDGTNKYGSLVKKYSTGTDIDVTFNSGNVTISEVTSLEREIDNPALSYSKVKLKLVSEESINPQKYAVSSILNNSKYYISDSSTGQLKVLTVNTADNSVSFQPLNGEKNQEWIISAKKDSSEAIAYYKISNAATGLLLTPQEESGAVGTKLVAQTPNTTSDQELIKWSINDKGSGKYEIVTQLSSNVLTSNGTLQVPTSPNSQFYFLYSDY